MTATDAASVAQDHVLKAMSTDHIRVAVVGNVDAGKSTLIGTCTTGKLDDGRGSSRAQVTTLKHELESGRTSSISSHLMAFDQDGKVVTSTASKYREAEIITCAHKTVSLMDLAGHERYFRTTIAGLSRGMADYALVLVNASQPPTHMTVNHLTLCISCGIPVVVVITKVDHCPDEVFSHTKSLTSDAVRSRAVGKHPFTIRCDKEVDLVKHKMHALVPVVETSCVTGEGLDLLRKLLYVLPRRRIHEKKINRPFEFLVEDTFNVTGVGTVLSGFVNAGTWTKGDAVNVGPLANGDYIKATVRSVHVAQTDVNRVWAGHSACFALALSKTDRRLLGRLKGACMLKDPVQPPGSFTAEICLLRGDSMTMTKGTTQSTAHILNMKRAVRLVNIDVVENAFARPCDSNIVLRPGDRARVTFSFIHGPSYLRKGMRVVLRDGGVRGIGIVKEVHL